MNTLDYILIALIVVAGHRALGYIIRHKGSCCGDCSQCGRNDCRNREDCQDETDER